MTTSRRPSVLLAERIEAEAAEWLSARCRITRADLGSPEFDDAIADADGLVVRTYTTVDGALLARGPRLRVVGRAGVGLDNIDLQACASREIEVVSTPDANTQSVVEFTICSILDHVRPSPSVRAGLSLSDWKRERELAMVEHDLADLTLGIWGLGRIGSRVAGVAQSLGVQAIYHDIREIERDDRHGARAVSRDELLAKSDILTIHVDGREENRGLLSQLELSVFKPGVLIVNTSRGFVVDENALGAFLRENAGARAILDVHDPEPISADSPLLGCANATLTPHIAAGTRSAKQAMSWVVRDVWQVLSKDRGE